MSFQNPDYAFQSPDRGNVEVADGVAFHPETVFGSVGGRDLTADVFTPSALPATARPAIVFLHGGSWISGGPGQFHFHSNYLAKKYGFFAVSVDYRMSGEAQFPAALQDAKCAMRWVRSQAEALRIDPDRVIIAGGSAGAHLSSMLITTAGVEKYEGSGGHQAFSSHANLAVLFNGEFDMWDLVEKKSLLDEMTQFMGGTPEETPERYDELSSIKAVHKDVPPVLLLHGTKDQCVSHEQSIAFYKRLGEHGVHAEIEIYEGKPHAWFNNEPDRKITTQRMERFLVDQFALTASDDV